MPAPAFGEPPYRPPPHGFTAGDKKSQRPKDAVDETQPVTAGSEVQPESASEEDPTSETSLSIIKSRYARGDISRDEYLQLKADLSV